MDLTPPSLTTSPYSPQRKAIDSPPPYAYCLPEVSSAVNYAALTASDNYPYNIPPPYGSLIDPLLADQAVDGTNQLSTVDAMASAGNWNSHPVTAAGSPEGSTVSAMPHVLSSEYDHFNYQEQSCLPGPYNATVTPYGRAPAPSPAFMQTPPPSHTDLPPRESTSFSAPRGSFSFAPEQGPAKPELSETMSFPPLEQNAAFTPPRPLHARPITGNPPVFLGGEFAAAGHSPSPAPSQLQHPQPQLPAAAFNTQLSQPLSRLPSAGMRQPEPKLRQPSQWTRFKQPKKNRPIRKHTTQAEANFQCTHKGCGKYFSRSYNYKSHLETHDDKREYPFPCTEDGCNKKFVRKTDLQRHHQSVHAKERNHKCDYCGRMFARKDTLRRHMEDGCPKRFEIGMLDTEDYTLDLGSHKLPPAPKAGDMMMGITLPPPMVGARAMPGLDSWR